MNFEMRRPYSDISGHPYPTPVTPTPNYTYSNMSYVAHPPTIFYPHYYHPYGYDASQYNRKRQRRQAAAVVVESLWNNNNMGRKSTAQPRPVLHIPPRGIGPIVDPNENDVLCGRGGRINSHEGNIQFRDVICERKKDYLAPSTKKLEKAHIAASIINDIRSMDPSGRFLKEDRGTGLWFDIGDAKAIKKTGQALREDAPDIRHGLEGDSSGDEKKPNESPTKETSEEKKAESKSESPQKPAASKKLPAHQTGMASARGPQHVPNAWQQQNAAAMMTQKDYQAQAVMPPPYSQQANPYMQHQQVPQQSFATRTIPIQTPMPQAIYSLPNQLVTGARSVGRRVTHASRHALDALQPAGQGKPRDMLPEDVAFGRQFHAPTATVLSSDNTMSTISGISDPSSSTLGGSGLMSDLGKGSAISGLSGLSGLSGMDTSVMSPSYKHANRPANMRDPSLRFSQLGVGSSGMGHSSRSQFVNAMKSSRMSDLTGSVRSMESLGRSLSFNDMNSIADDGTWKAIMEDEEMFQGQETSLLSGEVLPMAPTVGLPYRDSSAMSITSLSTASSSKWLAGLKDSNMGDDGRSVLSEMSSDLHALDLARPGDSRPQL